MRAVIAMNEGLRSRGESVVDALEHQVDILRRAKIARASVPQTSIATGDDLIARAPVEEERLAKTLLAEVGEFLFAEGSLPRNAGSSEQAAEDFLDVFDSCKCRRNKHERNERDHDFVFHAAIFTLR